MSSKYLQSDTKGLTLIECTISILVLSVTLAGGLMIYSHASTIMSKAMHKKIALEMAIQEMEKIKSTGYASLTLTIPPNTWENLADKTVGALTTQPFTAQLRRRITEVGTVSPKMKKVEFELKIDKDVPWTEDGHDSRIIKFETLVSP